MQNSEYDQKLLRRQQCSARLDNTPGDRVVLSNIES